MTESWIKFTCFTWRDAALGDSKRLFTAFLTEKHGLKELPVPKKTTFGGVGYFLLASMGPERASGGLREEGGAGLCVGGLRFG